MDNGTAAFELSERWGIETRPGLHCSPLGHRTLGTFPSGALRISIGFFNTEQEIEVAIEALCTLAAENAPL
jgi:selenocysteine lyase/cysteine desulfurase